MTAVVSMLFTSTLDCALSRSPSTWWRDILLFVVLGLYKGASPHSLKHSFGGRTDDERERQILRLYFRDINEDMLVTYTIGFLHFQCLRDVSLGHQDLDL